ncbi:MAG: PAS domain-containing protein [Psychrobium sp.]
MIKVAENPIEVLFEKDELIISKTDLRGNITYANRVFMRVSNFPESVLHGQPHNIIRHPDMPRGVYYALWKTLKAKREFFGFVKNLTAEGNYYWVFANITPDMVKDEIQGFFSVRRLPPRHALKTMEAVYDQMHEIERKTSPSQAAKASWEWLEQHLRQEHNMSYEQYVLKLCEQE